MTYPTIETEISEMGQNFQKWPQKAKKSTSSDRAQNFRKCCSNIDGHSVKILSSKSNHAKSYGESCVSLLNQEVKCCLGHLHPI